MRLNLFCADRYQNGWINVDWEGSPHPRDLTVDLTGVLPWEPQTISAVMIGHGLEHITADDALMLLERLLPCMQHGGQILVVGPDVHKAEQMIDAGTFDYTYHNLDVIKWGGDRWPGDKHLWFCTTNAVMDMLVIAGWSHVTDWGIENVPDTWPVVDRNQLWQCAVRAIAQ